MQSNKKTDNIKTGTLSWEPKVTKKNGPLYKAICEQLKSDIQSGALPPGTKLPPQRDLARFLGVNVSTVSRALRISEEEGLLLSTVGSGTFVAPNAVNTPVTSAHTGGSGTVELGVLAPRLIDHEALTAVLREAAASDDAGALFEYQYDSKGGRPKAAGVRLITRAGASAAPETILFAQGTQNAVAASIFAFFKPGDRLGCDPLVFPSLKAVCGMAGVRLVPIRWEKGEISESGLDYAIKQEKLKGLFVMPEHQVPTAITMSSRTRDMIASKARQHDLLVIEAAMSGLAKMAAQKSISSRIPERTIFITGLSTMIAPGLRCAFISAQEEFHAKIDSSLKTIDTSPSPLLLELASRIILGERFNGMIETVRNRARARNMYVGRYLPELEISGDAYSPFKWCVIPKDIASGAAGRTGRFDIKEFEDAAHDAGVQIQGAHRFTVGQADPPAAFRICPVSAKDEHDLVKGLKIIRKTISEFQ